jgi:pimeloyl-ACP methyl ester carboxylesterase
MVHAFSRTAARSRSFSLGPQGGSLRLPDGARMDWLQLGYGARPVVVVPGALDGLWTARQSPAQFVLRYRPRLRSCRLLILSRREPIPAGFDPAAHAEDYLAAVEQLGWGPSVWECISAGGPIGQWAAVRDAGRVRGLILLSTTHRADETLGTVLSHWRDLAERRRWATLYASILDLNDHRSRVLRCQALRPLLKLVPAPRSPQRFVNLVDELMKLDSVDAASRITCPTLVITGDGDRIIRADLQREMASLIRGSRHVVYRGAGHAAPIEHPDYWHVTGRFMEAVLC